MKTKSWKKRKVWKRGSIGFEKKAMEEISALRKQLTHSGADSVATLNATLKIYQEDIESLRHSLSVARTTLLIITEEYEQDFAISRCAKKMRDRAFEALSQLEKA